MKNIEVYFNNNDRYTIAMESNSVATKLTSMLKHLSKVPLRFDNFDNPYRYRLDIVIDQLLTYANILQIAVDRNHLDDQLYLNYLHSIYETSYSGTVEWLRYHESIHMLEFIYADQVKNLPVNLGYRELAGPLDKLYTQNELTNNQTRLRAGDCFIEFSELGKTPYIYWRDNEPDDFNRLCELAKPMRRLNFKLQVALHDRDLMPTDINEFNTWFDQYKDSWCRHWEIPSWSTEQIVGVIVVGHIDNISEFDTALSNGYVPTNLGLVDE